MTLTTESSASSGLTPLDIDPEVLEQLVEKKVTCPFLGPAVGQRMLGVFRSVRCPLARVDEVVSLGDSGGGDLGSRVLKIFARGNHSWMPGPDGRMTVRTPEGMMSLDLAGSQGAHPGHSGILLGDPTRIDGGRFSAANFERLSRCADESGLLGVSTLGTFIAENLSSDPDASVLPLGRLARDVFGIMDEIGDSLFAGLLGRKTSQDDTELLESLTTLAGEDNLIGSAGEYGLLFAFLAHQPNTALHQTADKSDEHEQSLFSVQMTDVNLMMVQKRLPAHWDTWPKFAADWVKVTMRIAASAARAHLRR